MGLSDRWELLVDLAAKRLFDRRKKIKEVIGARPYRGLPVSEDEVIGRYNVIRHDPEAMTNLLMENAKVKPDGRVLLPTELVSKMIKAEQKLRLGGYD